MVLAFRNFTVFVILCSYQEKGVLNHFTSYAFLITFIKNLVQQNQKVVQVLFFPFCTRIEEQKSEENELCTGLI